MVGRVMPTIIIIFIYNGILPWSFEYFNYELACNFKFVFQCKNQYNAFLIVIPSTYVIYSHMCGDILLFFFFFSLHYLDVE